MNRIRLPAILLAVVLLAAAPLQVAASNGGDGDDAQEPDANESSDPTADPERASDEVDPVDNRSANETAEETSAEDEVRDPDDPDPSADAEETRESDVDSEGDEVRDPAAEENSDDLDEDRDAQDHDGPEDRDDTDRRDARREAGEDDDEDGDERREIRLRISNGEAEVRSRSRQADVREEVAFRFRTEEAAFRLEARNETRADRADVDLRVTVPQLLEYEDLDGNGRYDLTDRVLSTVDVRAAPATLTDTSVEGVARFHVAYALPGGGTFTVATFVPDARTRIGNGTVAAGEAKIDFIVEGFNYTSPTSALALRVDVDSGFEARARGGTEVASEGGNQRAYFRWADWALVDGRVEPVHAAVYAVEEHAANASARPIVYLSYARGDSIVHDPTLGVVAAQTLDDVARVAGRLVLGDLPAYAAAVGLSTLLVAGLAWARTGGGRKSG